MKSFIITAISAFIFYLIFTLGGWSVEDAIAGSVFALIVAAIAKSYQMENIGSLINPFKIIVVVLYLIGPFFLELARANCDVALRVITGKIRPGIIRYDPKLKTDLGTMFIASSITLTPGTLTVDVNEQTNELYIHLLNVKVGDENKEIWSGKDIFSYFDLSGWIRRITE